MDESKDDLIDRIVRRLNAAGCPVTRAEVRAGARKAMRWIREWLADGGTVNLGGIVLQPTVTLNPDGSATVGVEGRFEEEATHGRKAEPA
jgi:hypothetical protein